MVMMVEDAGSRRNIKRDLWTADSTSSPPPSKRVAQPARMVSRTESHESQCDWELINEPVKQFSAHCAISGTAHYNMPAFVSGSFFSFDDYEVFGELNRNEHALRTRDLEDSSRADFEALVKSNQTLALRIIEIQRCAIPSFDSGDDDSSDATSNSSWDFKFEKVHHVVGFKDPKEPPGPPPTWPSTPSDIGLPASETGDTTNDKMKSSSTKLGPKPPVVEEEDEGQWGWFVSPDGDEDERPRHEFSVLPIKLKDE